MLAEGNYCPFCRGTFGDLSSFEEGLCSGSWFMSAQVGA